MHHAIVDRWSRGRSPLHQRDPRVKIAALLILLLAQATTPASAYTAWIAYFAMLLAGIVAAELPPLGLLTRAAAVVPFALLFSLPSFLAGDSARALSLILKSYLSAVAVLLLIGTTTLPALLRGFAALGCPVLLVSVIQATHRYLFVMVEQAQRMRLAIQCRGGSKTSGLFAAASGALAVLWGKSYARANGVHQCMMARGYQGQLPNLIEQKLSPVDLAFCLLFAAACLTVRFAA